MSAPRRNVAWVKPEQPSFLKAFKAKVGYKEPDTIDAKRAKVLPSGEGDGGGDGDEERDDELPTVVVLKKGDVGEEEYHKFCESMKEKKEEQSAEGGEDSGIPTAANRHQTVTADSASGEDRGEGAGKIVFKRPVKRRRSSEGVLDASTKKTRDEVGRRGKVAGRTRKGSSSAVKNSSLLSFGGEEED